MPPVQHPQPPQPQIPPQPGFRPNEPWRVQAPRRRRAFPAGKVAAVVAALVVVGGGGVGLYAKLSGGRKPADTTATAANADAVFASAPGAASDGSQQMFADVAAVGNTVVAAGSERNSSLSRPRFVVSQDGGHTWAVADIKTEPGARPGGAIPFKIVGTAGAWLALGRTSDHFAAWTSADGRSWLKIRDSASAFHATDHLQQIAKSAQGYIAIGYETKSGNAGKPILWLSADGRSWRRIEGGKLPIPAGKNGSIGRLDYVAAAGQSIVISGDIQKSGHNNAAVAALWRSTDRGRTWTQVALPTSNDAFGTIHLAATPRGFFAVRKAKDGDARNGQVISSRDGVTWRTAGQFALGAGESENFQSLAGGDQGLAALVTGPGNRILVYRSGDGATWQPPTDLGQVRNRTIDGLAVTGGGAVIIDGYQQGTDQNFYLDRIDESGRPGDINLAGVRDAVIPDRSVQALATAGGRTVAVGGTNGDPASWTSADGVTWRRSDTSGLAGQGQQSFTDVAQGGQGWVAIGADGPRPIVATSPDASSWHRLPPTVLGSTAGARTLSSVASGPKGYVVVGWAGTVPQKTSAAAWYSADLTTWRRAAGLEATRTSWPRMLDAAGTSTGYVAVGDVVDPTAPAEKRSRPEVWTSPDGLRWKAQQPELPDRMLNGSLTHVAVGGQTIAALGRGWFENQGYRAFAVVSGDSGLTWSALELPLAAAGAADVTVTAMTATSRGFAAAGTVDASGDEDVVLWTSADGRSWSSSSPRGPALSGTGTQRITALTVVRSRLLGVGLTADSHAQHVTLWQGPAG
ncbi:MAG TPA: hypothetical protein VF069_03450 [Streptosporangiaceae bacterium]